VKTILGVVALLLLGTRTASGAPTIRSDADRHWIEVLPVECLPYAPPRDHAHPLYWDLRLSLAACVQDASVLPIDSPLDVEPLVTELTQRLVPAMMVWRDALDRGPPVVQLRAAFHIGFATVAMMTRARRSIGAPPQFSKVDAAERERVLRARLEPYLTPSKQVAWAAFSVIDKVARDVPEFEADPVHRSMVRTARTLLPLIEPPQDPEQDPEPRLAGPP